jgi:hypothetical protein
MKSRVKKKKPGDLTGSAKSASGKRNLAEFLMDSPLRGSRLSVKKLSGPMGKIDL